MPNPLVKGSRPDAKPAACPVLLRSGTGQASPTATAEAEAAGEGTEIRSQASASEPETAQALIPNGPSGVNGVYDPKRFGTKKGDR